MRRLKCPVCDTVNYEGFITYPNCSHCRENLHQCRYCQHFPGEGGECRFQPGLDLQNGDAVVDCAHRMPSLEVGRETVLNGPLGSAGWMAVVAAMVLGLVVAGVSVVDFVGKEKGKGLSIKAELPPGIAVGDEVTATVTVSNDSGNVPSTLMLRLPRQFFDGFDFVRSTPPAESRLERGSGVYFVFKNLPAQRKCRLSMTLHAVAAGEHKLVVSVRNDLYANSQALLSSSELLARVKDDSKPASRTVQALPALIVPPMPRATPRWASAAWGVRR